MNSDKAFIRYTWLVLYTIFAVILAGSIVRTTHSGMGCPDWPHCFGRLIPPLNAGQLPKDYEKYLRKQDIDHTFNAFHTWIEYCNRLLTVLLGIFITGQIVWATKKYFKSKPVIFYLALVLMFLVGLEAWIGKTVVNTNLNVMKITAHMFPSLVIAGVCLLMIHILENNGKIADGKLLLFLWIALVLVLIQTLIGTQVRAEVDNISKAMRYTERTTWLKQVSGYLQTHEAFAWVAALSCIFVAGKTFTYKRLQRTGLLILVMTLSEVFLGLIMTQLNMPAFAQPLHLLVSSILVVAIFSLMLRVKQA